MGVSNFLRRIRGLGPRSASYGKDIDLPLEAGQRRDPRLPEKPNVGKALGGALEGFKSLRQKKLIGSKGRGMSTPRSTRKA